jgi:1-acyl-sn-glycerol-3-phosphate acyltransferase
MSSLPRSGLRHAAAVVSAWSIVLAARLLTGVRAIWSGTTPKAEQTLYFANHTSHGDFVLLWATLPPDLRAAPPRARPTRSSR